MTDEKPILYSYWRSSCTWRVRIALALKQIPYDIIPVDIFSGNIKEKREKYLEVNPMGFVPALKIDGHTLIESVAIMHYLEETRPGHPLLPQDPLKRTKVREVVEVICAGIQPLQNTGVLMTMDEDKRNPWASRWIARGFEALEKLLIASSGKYCVGNEITMADICLVPQVFNADKVQKMDLSPYPNIVRINKELESHPAFRAADALNQPDFDPSFFKK